MPMYFVRNEKGQFISPYGAFDQVFQDIAGNIKRKYADDGKRAMYLALDELGRIVVERVKQEHSSRAWYNEPYPDRSPGDYEATLTYYVVPAPGEERFLTPEMMERYKTAYEKAEAEKHMEVGMRLFRRGVGSWELNSKGGHGPLAGTRVLGQSEFERHHQTSVNQGVHGTFEIAKLIVTTPMEYAIYVEGGEYNGRIIEGSFPILHRVMDEEAQKITGNFIMYFRSMNAMKSTGAANA